MIVEDAIHDALEGLKNVLWRETAFADLQWYYAEGGVYVLRCKKGDPNEHLCVIRASSADEAISRAVFNLYKADEKKKSAPVGDSAKLREACANIVDYVQSAMCHATDAHVLDYLTQVEMWAKAALAAPPRNCDVGTAEEQAERWGVFCNRYDDYCRGCPCDAANATSYTDCFAQWAQLPYEEGGAK